MKKLFAFIILLAIAWYFGSPLIIDKEVDEAFPEISNAQSMLELEDAIPSENELEALSENELKKLQQAIDDTAAAMPDKEMDDQMPSAALIDSRMPEQIVVASGSFVGADSFHSGEGSAKIYSFTTIDTPAVLRLEDFRVTNGPDLRVLLSKSADVLEGEYVELGKLKGNIGNQNYEISTEVYKSAEFSEYSHVIIYCKPFHVVFATASIQ